MTGHSSLKYLIGRLQQAQAGSAALDEAIAVHLKIKMARYSRSIDAALKLVPAQWRLHYLDDTGQDNGARCCRCLISMENERDVEECGSTAPLAITIAALKAHLDVADHAAHPAQREGV